MYDSTSRALAALELLQARGLQRAEDIAAELEVDSRTVRRYVMILRERGVPIEMKRGRHGGYTLAPGYRAPLALTREEALALTWGLLGAPQARTLPDTASQPVERPASGGTKRALRKVARALPAELRAFIQSMEGAVTFATPVAGGDTLAPPEHLAATARAIRMRRRLAIHYQAGGGEVTAREVDPYQIVHRYGRWYLVGYCHLRHDARVFRLDHILSATLMDAPDAGFIPPDSVDAVALVERAIAQAPWRWEFTVVAEMAADAVARRLDPTFATLHPHPRGTLLHGYMDDLDHLAYTLAGLRCPLSIIAPPELRGAFLALAESARAIAESDTADTATSAHMPQ